MKSRTLGRNTLKAEVSVISEHGFWLLVGEKEYFVDFDDHPWFKSASVGAIMNVEFVCGSALVWPDLDVDLELASLEHPEDYPLVSSSAV